MPDQNTDPKTQWQWQAPTTEENNEHVAFGWSDDFFDDPNFLNKIGQWNTNPNIENNDEVNLWDISNVFDNNKHVDDTTEENDEIENLDLEMSPFSDEEKKTTETTEEESIKEDIVSETPVVEEKPIEDIKIEPEAIVEEPIVVEEPKEEDKVVEEKPVEEPTIPETIETVPEVGSDFVRKFNELKKILSDIDEAKDKLGYEKWNFDVIWANSDVNKVTYSFGFNEEWAISITKTELDKKTQEESEHTLFLNIENEWLNVGMDDVIIFEENKDLQNDQKKKIQVMEKINKFIFLAGEYQNTIQMELKEKLEEEQEKKKMQDIFRNF